MSQPNFQFGLIEKSPLVWSEPRSRPVRRAVGRGGEGLGVDLVDAGRADVVQAVLEALPELAGAEEPLLGEYGGRQRQVVVRREVEEDRQTDAVAELRFVERSRREQAGLAGDRWVGRRQERQVGEGDAQELEVGILVVDHLLLAFMDDPLRPHAPKRRPVGVVLAGIAGGVGAAVEDGGVAVRPLGARAR